MTQLRLYNSLTNQKEKFIPIDPGHIRLYTCGPTVYNYAHIGNARPAVVFDLLTRVLLLEYKLFFARKVILGANNANRAQKYKVLVQFPYWPTNRVRAPRI